jgi:hypothetical protein
MPVPIKERPIVNRLREEYFDLLPDIRRVALQIEAEVRYHTLSTLHKLKDYEQLEIKSRVKECESAVHALRRRQEGGSFDPERLDLYSLLRLSDLAGVRVLVFQQGILKEVDDSLRKLFPDWNPDPISLGRGKALAPKYSGKCTVVSNKIQAEYQVVPMLIGLYWQVEHSAIYKPPPAFKGKAESAPMRSLGADVECALLNFEAEFERLARDST